MGLDEISKAEFLASAFELSALQPFPLRELANVHALDPSSIAEQ